MPLQRKSNPSDAQSFRQELLGPDLHHQTLLSNDEGADMRLQDRIRELETRNLHLQSLVVELLDKNEQLRLRLAKKEELL